MAGCRANVWQRGRANRGIQRLVLLAPRFSPIPCPSRPAAEADAAQQGIQRLVLLTTRTADWFEQRGFRHAGAAHLSALLPDSRRQRVDPSRNSQLFSKPLAPRKG